MAYQLVLSMIAIIYNFNVPVSNVYSGCLLFLTVLKEDHNKSE